MANISYTVFLTFISIKIYGFLFLNTDTRKNRLYYNVFIN